MSDEELKQQNVVQLRPMDLIEVMQNGIRKKLMVQAIADFVANAMANMMATAMSTFSLQPHTHPESDISGLTTDLNNLSSAISGKVDSTTFSTTVAGLNSAIAGKANASHTHQIGDIKSNFVDGTQNPAVKYDGCYPATFKATVSGGNAVFNFTNDGTAGGTAVFPNGPLPNSEVFRAEEGTNPTAFGIAAWSNGNKTLTVPVSRVGAAVTILGLSVLGATVQANGVVVYATAWGR